MNPIRVNVCVNMCLCMYRWKTPFNFWLSLSWARCANASEISHPTIDPPTIPSLTHLLPPMVGNLICVQDVCAYLPPIQSIFTITTTTTTNALSPLVFFAAFFRIFQTNKTRTKINATGV